MKYKDLPEERRKAIFSRITDPEDFDVCFKWQGSVDQNGRPIYRYETKVDGKRKGHAVFVQHFVLEEVLGRSLTERYVSVLCKNLTCCNPEHLAETTTEISFLTSFDVGNDDECWEWEKGLASSGYGLISRKNRHYSAHRYSYEYYKEPIPEGLFVCHTCDNKKCVNPNHLYVGTHSDNMRDVRNSNVQKGSNNGNSILTEKEVQEIKELIQGRKVIYRKIAEMYGVSRQAIKDIALGRTWKWVE